MQGFCVGATGKKAWVGGGLTQPKAEPDVLSPRALDLKRAIEKKLPKAEFVKKTS